MSMIGDALGGRGRTYDLTIYGIVKFFNLAMHNNPNIIDSLFTPVNCVLHSTRVGDIVRENRKLFLHKGAWSKFKNYAYAQLHKLSTKVPQGKRAELVVEHGYDTKFAYHVVRLILEVEQILVEGDIDLQRNNEQLKAIRRGEWTETYLREWFSQKQTDLERVYSESKLRPAPDEERNPIVAPFLPGRSLRQPGRLYRRSRSGGRRSAERSGRARESEGPAVSDRDNNAFVADQRLRDVVSRQPYPLIFATISGAHLYGFPSPDSDYDLRGCHLLPVKDVDRP